LQSNAAFGGAWSLFIILSISVMVYGAKTHADSARQASGACRLHIMLLVLELLD
jgi:hypothetical protein